MEEVILQPQLEDEEEVSAENIEEFLKDCIFIQFFNNFLSLQVFEHRLLYNAVTGHFEEFTNSIAFTRDSDEPAPTATQSIVPRSELSTRKGYYLKTLTKSEGLNWIRQHRLPFFLKSEIYADYKLAKLLTSCQTNLFHKFFRPKLNFLHDLVSKTLPPLKPPVSGNAHNQTHNNSCGNDEKRIDKCDKERRPSVYVTELNLFTVTNSKENKIFSDVRKDAYQEINKIKFLSGYINSTPCLRNKLLHESSFKNASRAENSLEFEGNNSTDVSELHQYNQNKAADDLLKQLHRNIHLQEITDNIRQETDFFVNDYQQKLNDILLVVDEIKRTTNLNSNELPRIQFQNLLSVVELWPINLSYKKGIDAFKEFLCETTGGRHLLLWLQVETSKHFNMQERKIALRDIKDRFFRSGSPHCICKQTLRSWGIEQTSKVTIEHLLSIQGNILQPLLCYWCPRFTLHLYGKKLKHEKEAKRIGWHDYGNKKLDNYLPRRPLSCKGQHRRLSKHTTPSNYSTTTKESRRTSSGFFSAELSDSIDNRTTIESDRTHTSISSVDIFDGMTTRGNGVTKQNRRAKSAHPRLLTTPNTRNTNASYEQLVLTSAPAKEGYGFKPLPGRYFHNDASDINHRKSVRLYVAPIPAFDASASTISEKANFWQEELEQSCNKCYLDSLVDVLLHEKHTGNYFGKFLEQQDNTVWLNCYRFWKAFQDYGEYFLSASFAPDAVKRKSSFIYSKFILSDSEYDVECSLSLQSSIFKKLDPPYEDLFDEAEKHALVSLLRPYAILVAFEENKYNELKLKEELKHIEVPPMINKKLRITEEEEDEVPNVLEESKDKDKISPEQAEQPPQFADGFNFDALLRSKSEMEHFRAFLELHHKQGILDLKAWTDFEVFRTLPRGKHDDQESERDKKALENREKWLGKHYFFGVNSPATKAGQKKILELAGKVQFLPDRPSTPVSNEAHRYIRARLERKWLTLFKESSEYQERMKSEENTNKMVEDLLMQKKLRTGHHSVKFMKLSHATFSNANLSKLRTAISNPSECELFRRFIRVCGELMENNLDFWLEVQKYKELCHNHVEESIIRRKIQAIVDVYIKSAVLPEVQIDVPAELAERLHEKACGRFPQHSPYLFREAQSTVIRVMFDNWNEYLAYREKFEDHVKLTESLETLETQYRQENAKRRLLSERKRLWRLLSERNKQEPKEAEVSKVQQDLLNIVQNNISSKEGEESGDVASFLYSKHLAEGDLQNLEERMREHGITDGIDSSTKKSTFSLFSRKTAVEVVASGCGKSRRGSSVLKEMVSERQAWNDQDLSLDPSMLLPAPKDKSVMGSSVFGNSMTSRKKSRFGKKCPSRKSDNFSSASDVYKTTSTNLTMLKEYPEENGVECGQKLTRKSLLEFERTQEGKQLSIPLPIVRIHTENECPQMDCAQLHPQAPILQTDNEHNDLENEKRLPHITETEKAPKKKRKKKSVIDRPLPRNAGTASLIAKLQRETIRVESPPPEINAVVVVC